MVYNNSEYKVAYQAGKDEDDAACYHLFVFQPGRSTIFKKTFHDVKEDGKIIQSAKDLAVDYHNMICDDFEGFMKHHKL